MVFKCSPLALALFLGALPQGQAEQASRHLRAASTSNTPFQRKLQECDEGHSLFELELTLDTYPKETTWSLTDTCTGTELLTGGPYRKSWANTTLSESLCVEDSMGLSFKIYDDFGDGICCFFVDGGYTLAYNGEAIFAGGTFNETETTEVVKCATGAPTAMPSDMPSDVPSDMPSDIPTASPTIAGTESPTADEVAMGSSLLTSSPSYASTDGPTADASTGTPTGAPIEASVTVPKDEIPPPLDESCPVGYEVVEKCVLSTKPAKPARPELTLVTQSPTMEGTIDATDSPTYAATAGVTGAGTTVSSFASTESTTTVALTEGSTVATTEGATVEATYDTTTEAPTESATEAATIASTESATTEAPTEGSTVAATEAASVEATYDATTEAPTEDSLVTTHSGAETEPSIGGGGDGSAPELPPCGAEESLLEVKINLDNWASETYWYVYSYDCDDSFYYGCQYNDYMRSPKYTKEEGGTEAVHYMCVPFGKTYFYIYDSYGDGMCCDHGEGSYTLSLDGVVAGEGGNFGRSERQMLYPGTDLSEQGVRVPFGFGETKDTFYPLNVVTLDESMNYEK